MSVAKPTAGTYVRGDTAANRGKVFAADARKRLLLRSGQGVAFLRYAPPSPGDTVISAPFRFPVSPDFTGTVFVQPHARPAVGYGTMRWTSAPAVMAGTAAVQLTRLSSGVYGGDLAVMFQQVADGMAWHGLRIWTTDNAWRYGRGWAAANAATLDIQVSRKPPTPTGLWPAGVVSKATFVASWGTDPSASQYRLQVDEAGGDFTSPLVDVTVPTPVGQYDLAASWAGQAVGGEVDWRVRASNTDGDSAWSLPLRVKRLAKVTAAWVGGLVAGDGTPPREWSVTGGVQRRWELAVTKPAGGSWAPPEKGSVETLWTPSAGPSVQGQAVRDVLRVWGNLGHVDVPGDPAYTELVRDWTLDLTGAGSNAGSGMTVAQVLRNGPLVRIGWTSPAVPDGWRLSYVTPDGAVHVLDDLDGTDGRVGTSTTWRVETWRLPPNTDVEVRLQSVTNGVPSAALVATVRLPVTGVWLADEATGDWVACDGLDVGAVMRHGTVVNTTLTGQEVAYSHGVAGYGGTVSGLSLTNDRERSREEMRGTVLEWMLTPEVELRQIWHGLNIPVRVREMSPFPDNEMSFVHELRWGIGWIYSQSGEYPADDAG